MSTPPNPSETPTARFMMDGILHNMARKQRVKAQQSQGKRPLEQGPSSPRPEQPVWTSDKSPENATSDYFTLSSNLRPRKGILKSPTVHFPEELDLQDDADVPHHVASALSPTGAMGHSRYHDLQPPTLPPPPPPPPPVQSLPAPPPPPPFVAPQPPTLFDRAIEADEYLNEAAFKLYTKFIDELSEFVDMQGEVTRIRLQVQEKRQELKRLRENVSQCDMILIDHLRQFMTTETPSADTTLIALFEASQAARDQVGPIEAEYEPLEIGLGADEYRLKEKYAAIERRFEHFFRLNATSTTRQSIPSKIEYEASTAPSASGDRELSDSEPRGHDLFHGAFIGEQVGIGQGPLPAESSSMKTLPGPRSLGTRTANRTSDTAEYFRKHRSSATMDDIDEEELPADLLGIAGTEESNITPFQESERRDRRISQSLRGVASHALFKTLDEKIEFPDDLPLDPGLQEGDVLLLLDEHVKTQTILSDHLISFDSTRDRVNRWILHQLRLSRREVYALRRQVIECKSGIPDWAMLALSEWPHDLLGHGQSYHQGSIEDEDEDKIPLSLEVPYPPSSTTRPFSPESNVLHKVRSTLKTNETLFPTTNGRQPFPVPIIINSPPTSSSGPGSVPDVSEPQPLPLPTPAPKPDFGNKPLPRARERGNLASDLRNMASINLVGLAFLCASCASLGESLETVGARPPPHRDDNG